MDPISSASAFSLVTQTLSQVVHAARRTQNVLSEDAMIETEILLSVLKELEEAALSMSQQLPRSTEACLQLCFTHVKRISELLEKRARSPLKAAITDLDGAVDKAVHSFRQSAMVLQGTVTRNLAIESIRMQQQMGTGIEELLRGLDIVMRLTKEVKSDPTEYASGDRETEETEFAEMRRRFAARYQARARNPFMIDAYVVSPDLSVGDGGRISATIKIDSQSSESWVNADVVMRLGMQSHIRPSDGAFEGFGGEAFEPEGIIILTWYAKEVGKTRDTAFLINSRSRGFDLLVGNKFMMEEGFATLFRDPVAPIRELDLTPEQIQEAQANMFRRNAQSEEVGALRRAKDAAKREQKREQRRLEASRMASRATTSLNTPATQSRRQSFVSSQQDQNAASSQQSIAESSSQAAAGAGQPAPQP